MIDEMKKSQMKFIDHRITIVMMVTMDDVIIRVRREFGLTRGNKNEVEEDIGIFASRKSIEWRPKLKF